MISKKTNIQLLVIITFFFNLIYAQTKPIEHIIKKGDNVYRLSLRYHVTMESIFNLNPGSRTLIKVGEILIIPSNAKSLPPSQNSAIKKHLVSKGETKYGLSKKYNVSIIQLEKANPNIVKMLIAGQTIDIPSELSDNQIVEKPSNIDEFHTVKKGETLWGISQKYGISLESLRSLNNDNIIDYPTISIGQVLALTETIEKSENKEKIDADYGTYTVIKGDTKYGLSKRFNISVTELEQLNPEIIPILKTGAIIKTRESELDKNALTNTKAATIENDDTEIKAINNSNNENSEAEPSIIRNSNLAVLWNNNFTFTGSELNDEKAKYYKGLILAIDSINKEYPQNKLSILNKEPFTNESLKTYVHPFDNSLNTTKSIDLFSITYKERDSLKKIFLKGLPSDEDMRDRVLDYLKTENGRIICLYDNENRKNKSSIETTLPDVNFIKINKKGAFQSEDLTDALSTEKKNFVIIESSDVGVFLNTTNILLKKMSSSDIQLVVLNSKNIPSKEKITTKRFKILRLLFPKQYDLEFNKDMDSTVALSFAINYDAFKRLNNKNVLEAFSNNFKTSFLGFSFNYNLNNKVLENKAVSLFIFDENSDHTLISKD